MSVVPLHSAHELHDTFVTLGKAYAAQPSRTMARYVEDAYRRFYVAYTGSTAGVDEAMDLLRHKMAVTMRRAG